MAIPNTKIAEVFDELADLLEIEGANPFRVRAYRNAARVIESYPSSLAARIEQGTPLPRLAGIGKDLEGKIRIIARTRGLPLLNDVAKRVPPGVRELLQLPGLGPKRVRALQKARGIESLAELERAARGQQLRSLPGFGTRTEEKILSELSRRKDAPRRFLLSAAEQSAEPLLAYLKGLPGVSQAAVAGSFRRKRETVGDLDLLVTCEPGAARRIMEGFTGYVEVAEVLSRGPTRSSVRLHTGMQIDLRVVRKESFGAALVYFTGSKAHNIAIRNLALRKKLKINEYGVQRGPRRIAGTTEEEVYRALGLPFIEPELREDRGELDAAARGTLPKLVTLEDLRGDLHGHTIATDGTGTLGEMAEAARERGYEYLAITDHSRRLTVAKGQTPERLRQQLRVIDRMNARLANTGAGLTLLKAAEVDILEDGSLDFPDSLLSLLDFTVCSVHHKFELSGEKQTERILRAMDNPYFTILGHPTGRLIDRRPPYAVDLGRIIAGARDRGCFLEVNSQPDRLDLADVYCKSAKESGVLLAISTDSHSPAHLGNIRLGLAQARRGWLEPRDVLNTRPLAELRELLRRRRPRG
ncbi:MAG: DNA polymerase/3'-5' exonuclease PolX [Oligoflexia bacterium]|nr:DNA polymerase/3'-5' exonuclease PolX [Oligoflexia bacterium]